jgi:hypothetical protein
MATRNLEESHEMIKEALSNIWHALNPEKQTQIPEIKVPVVPPPNDVSLDRIPIALSKLVKNDSTSASLSPGSEYDVDINIIQNFFIISRKKFLPATKEMKKKNKIAVMAKTYSEKIRPKAQKLGIESDTDALMESLKTDDLEEADKKLKELKTKFNALKGGR